jgi:hypothetical protein
VRRTTIAALAGMIALAQGCHFTATGSYWVPQMTSEQESGAGSDAVDLGSDFGIETPPGLVAFEILGQEGGQRLRLDYWQISTTGERDVSPTVNFANVAYDGPTESTMEFEAIGLLWEPGIQKGNIRLGLAFGADFVRFAMKADDLDVDEPAGDGEVEFPDAASRYTDFGLAHAPVPLVGASIGIGLREWLVFTCRAEAFDSAQAEIVEGVTAKFLRGDIGFTIGKPTSRGIKAFLGYRYFHVEYTYEEDSANTTLEGPVFCIGLRLGSDGY